MTIYNLDYFEKLLRLNSATAEQICRIRWKWIEEIHPKKLLDYGSGAGWFRAFRPPEVEVWSFDIGNFPQTGIKLQMYDCVCFFDCLEHIQDFTDVEPVLALAKHAAVTVPIKPPEKDFSTWKHLKPMEHSSHFTEESLNGLFKKYGFELMKKGQPEVPPREDITSFLFGRAK